MNVFSFSLLVAILHSPMIFAQCSKTEQWETLGYEDRGSAVVMHFPLMFDFQTDSIFVKNLATNQKSIQQVKYLVISGTCEWDAQGITGMAEYRVKIVATKKNATVKIKAVNGDGELTILMDSQATPSPKFAVKKIKVTDGNSKH